MKRDELLIGAGNEILYLKEGAKGFSHDDFVSLATRKGVVNSFACNKGVLYDASSYSIRDDKGKLVLKGYEPNYKGEIFESLHKPVVETNMSLANLVEINNEIFYTTHIPANRTETRPPKGNVFKLGKKSLIPKILGDKPIFKKEGNIDILISDGKRLYCNVSRGKDGPDRGIWNVSENEKISSQGANILCIHKGILYHSNTNGVFETHTGSRISDFAAKNLISCENLYGSNYREVFDLSNNKTIVERVPEGIGPAVQDEIKGLIAWNGELHDIVYRKRIGESGADIKDAFMNMIKDGKPLYSTLLDISEYNVLYNTFKDEFVILPFKEITAIRPIRKEIIEKNTSL